MTSFKSWLSDMLEKLEVDSDMYTEYIVGMLEEEENTIEENARTATEFLAEIADISESDFAKTLIEKFKASQKTTESSSNNSTTDQEEEDVVSRTIREAREFASQRQENVEASKRERKRLVEDLGLEEYLYVSEDILADKEDVGEEEKNTNRRRVEEERRKNERRRKKSPKPRKRETRQI